ncbi:MAG: alcohol dehydrogenase, partial [Actinomycetia bacterium]|nr:alcohol dehydrogenase [Actinomycetes bacterium]
ASDRIKPGAIVSHRLALEEAPVAYRKFDERQDGYIKVVIDPAV